MGTLETLFWATIALVGIAGSALYSGLETGAYRLNRVRLQVRHDRGDPQARVLMPLIQNQALLLSLLLVGNNLMNNLGTSGLAVVLEGAGFTDTQILLITVALVTPALFVFGEVLPKDLFGAHADRLMYRLSFVLRLSRWAYTAILLLPIIQAFSGWITRLLHSAKAIDHFHPRRRVSLLVKEGVGYGLLSDEQSAIVERVLKLSGRTVRDEMTPWKDVVAVEADAAPGRLWELADQTSHSRLPVVQPAAASAPARDPSQSGSAPFEVVGVVELMEALRLGPEACPPVRELCRPMLRLDQRTPLREGLNRVQASRHVIALVVDERDQPVGLVSIKDLVEPITGELSSW
jgi:CBS domain containing-hemolysin-like protein